MSALAAAYASCNSSPLRILAMGVALLLVLFVTSLCIGQMPISPRVVYDALFHYDPLQVDHIIVTTTRLSRAVIATVVGANLAVAGALMQAMTRNPLASPGLFGINAGAMFMIVVLSLASAPAAFQFHMWAAFAGAGAAGVMVYFIGVAGQSSVMSVRIILAAAAITAMFTSLTQVLLVINQEGLDSILFWLAGSVSGRSLAAALPVLGCSAAALGASMLLARHVNVLAAGDEIAIGLGQRTLWVKAAMAIIVVCLAGGAVAIAGTIGFVGLIVPHIVRRAVSSEHNWLIPACAIFGAVLLLGADVLSRVLIRPQEVPIGVITAVIGTPIFIYLLRRGFRHG